MRPPENLLIALLALTAILALADAARPRVITTATSHSVRLSVQSKLGTYAVLLQYSSIPGAGEREE